MYHPSLKPAIRSIIRNRIISIISILGLGIGLGCIIVLVALTIHEKSFDKFIPDHNNVYRLIYGNSANTHYPLAESMSTDFPEVKNFFRYYQAGSVQLKSRDNEIIRVSNFAFADSSVFSITGIRFIYGSYAVTTGEVAISEETATKYFGNENPLGKVVPVKFTNEFISLVVKGVYHDFPASSTLDPLFIADIRLSGKVLQQFQRSLGDFGNSSTNVLDWKYTEFVSYVVLDGQADPQQVAAKMNKYKELINDDKKNEHSFSLQPVADTYLGSKDLSGGFFLRKGNPEELIYYEVIALLIFIISLANYVLLTRAGVDDRMHELGTRKVFGSSNAGIIRLIFTESFIIVLLSMIPASFIIDYGIGFVNDTMNKTMDNRIFLNTSVMTLLAGILALTTILSGLLIGVRYSVIPALNLINKKPGWRKRPDSLNYSFLVLHFSIFMILASGVFTIVKQINFSMTGFVGINPKNILVTSLNSDELKQSFTSICDEIKRIPGVEAVAGGSFIPPFGNFLPLNLATPDGAKVRFDGLIMGEGMPELLGLEVSDGTAFGPFREGSRDILINESSAKLHNLKAGDNFMGFNIMGVLRDFHAHSLHSLIQPIAILQQHPQRMGLIAIKTNGINDHSVIKGTEDIFKHISPDEIFEIRYLTDDLTSFYTRENNQARIIGAFSILASILAVMGLFGISLIAISRRTKEIGIRKVNGSMVSEILVMLNTGFLKWVLVSVVISIPLSVYLLDLWLKRFAYKTGLSWWLFGLAALSAILIAVITVSWQSWKAATRNPVEALRYE